MKKQTNISLLKELVNNNVLERVKLRRYGVQAYNIAKGEEYTVIIKYARQGGRYYFIDRDGRRFLASHYDRAEFVAGEMLEIIAKERAAAMHAADQVEKSGSVLVCASLLDLFFEECDRRNIKVASSETGVDDLARMLTRYDLVKDAETAQQEDNDNDNDDNDTQSDDAQSNDTQSDANNEGEQIAAEPSRLAQAAEKVAEKVAEKAKTCATRAFFFASLAVVFVLSFSLFLACASALVPVFHAVGIEGGARLFFALCAFIPMLDVMLWFECNALAVVARLFPGMFQGSGPQFLAPGSFFWRVYRSNFS